MSIFSNVLAAIQTSPLMVYSSLTSGPNVYTNLRVADEGVVIDITALNQDNESCNLMFNASSKIMDETISLSYSPSKHVYVLKVSGFTVVDGILTPIEVKLWNMQPQTGQRYRANHSDACSFLTDLYEAQLND